MYVTSEGRVTTSLCTYARERATSSKSRRGRRRPLDQPAPPHAALVAAEVPVGCARRPRRARGVAAAMAALAAAAPIGCVERPRRLKRSPRFGSGGNACGGCGCAARGVLSACVGARPAAMAAEASAASEAFAGSPRFGSGGGACGGRGCAARGVLSACVGARPASVAAEASAASEAFAGSTRFGSGGNACGGCGCAAVVVAV